MSDPKQKYFVQSNFKREASDHYPTIDKRCTFGLLEHVQPVSSIDVCAPTGSGIVEVLKKCGYDSRCIGDAFTPGVRTQWIITNPPYERPLVDQIIERQIQRIADGEVFGVAMLLRTSFDHATTRKVIFKSCEFYHGQIKLLFRPWWNIERKKGPIHNYVWHLWTGLAGTPVVLYSNGLQPLTYKQNDKE